MKRLMLVLAVVACAMLVASSAMAQTATATASATILGSITVAKNADMNFGNLVPSGTSGTVVLTPAASPTRTPSGGVTLASGGTTAAAQFTVSGTGNATYTFSMSPATLTLTDGGTNQMTVTSLASSLGASGATGTLSSGSQVVYVGGTLNVNANQAAATYSTAAGALTVTVAYN